MSKLTDDKELLELAAKAAGIEVRYQAGSHRFIYKRALPILEGFFLAYWDPLTDDGAALRLAVKCKLTTCTDGEATVSSHEAYRGSQGVFITQRVSECEDKYAAVRRAIVRAAAEIGKGM
jgi:hypothetical protein